MRTSDLAWKSAVAQGAVFSARVFVIGGPPDADGDVILDDNDGATVRVSLDQHDSLKDPTLEPAGEAVLQRKGNAVIAYGVIADTDRGRALRGKLRQAGAAQEWSVGFYVDVSRAPTAKELEQWPDARRVITKWTVEEISPVRRGACGPTCRTTSAKCAGSQCDRVRESPSPAKHARTAVARPADEEIAECLKRDAALKAGLPYGVRVARAWERPPEHSVAFLERAVAAACKDLGLSSMHVRFFSDGRPGINGFYDAVFSPDAIWLKADRSVWDQLRTAGHELYHAKQHVRDEPADEASARWYGQKLRHSDPGDWPYFVRPAGYTQST
jgi:hypothetical protein